MEPFKMVVGTVLFFFVLICGMMSTLSLLLLTTNSQFCLNNQTTTTTTTNVAAVTYLLVSLGALEAINLLKNLFMSCQTYDQCWPKGTVLAWILVSQGLSTCGMSTLVLYLLPSVDLIRGAALLMSFGLLPMALKTFILQTFGDKKPNCKLIYVLSIVLHLIAVCIVLLHDFTTASFTVRGDLSSGRNSLLWGTPSIDFLAILATIFLVPFYWIDSYIEKDVTVMSKVIPLVSFKRQLNRSKHKAGLILPLWRALWVALCIFAFMPGYFKAQKGCSDTESSPVDKGALTALQTQSKKDLEALLRIDESHGNMVMKEDENGDYDWRFEFAKKLNPTWIPPNNIDQTKMVQTHEILQQIEGLITSKGKDSQRYHALRAQLDSTIMHGRYSKRTVKEYTTLLSYIDGSYSDTLTPSPELKAHDSAYRVLAIALVCSNVVAMLSAKAACHWRITRVSYVIPATLILPLSIVLIIIECQYSSPALAPLLRCAEPWSMRSMALLIVCVIWYANQLLLLCHSNNSISLESSSDFSIPLTSSTLAFGGCNSSITKRSRSTMSFQSSVINGPYRFSSIKKRNSVSDGNGNNKS